MRGFERAFFIRSTAPRGDVVVVVFVDARQNGGWRGLTVFIETPLRRDCRSWPPTDRLIQLGQLCRKKYDSALRGQLLRSGSKEWAKWRGGRTREGRRPGRIEQDQDPPRSNLALSHVRVIPFHPADEISPHLDSAYFAPCSAGPIAKPNTTNSTAPFPTDGSCPIGEIVIFAIVSRHPFHSYLFIEKRSIRGNCFANKPRSFFS